jgi:hypothetical protein
MSYDVNRPTSKEGQTISRYVNFLIGSKLPGIQENVAKVFGLYEFLLQHRHEPPHKLRGLITEGGAPVFTEAELQSILATLETQATTPFAKRIQGQAGGAAPTAVAATAATAIAAPAARTEPVDETRNKFWDKLIRKFTSPFTKSIPKCWDNYFWFLFLLYNLEQIEVLGPFISSALDTVTLSLPVLADIAGELASKLLLLVPLPYAGLAGDAIGYAISLIFVLFAVNLNFSRKHFGSAFQVSLEGIPIIGDILTEGAQKFELGAERYLINREKLIRGFQPVSPMMASASRYYSPGFDAYQGPPPPVALDTVIKDVKDYAMKKSGANAVLKTVQEGPAALTAAATGAATGAVTGAVTGATTAATGAVTEATTAMTSALPTPPTPPKIGTSVGGRRSRKVRRSKRRTTRRR